MKAFRAGRQVRRRLNLASSYANHGLQLPLSSGRVHHASRRQWSIAIRTYAAEATEPAVPATTRSPLSTSDETSDAKFTRSSPPPRDFPSSRRPNQEISDMMSSMLPDRKTLPPRAFRPRTTRLNSDLEVAAELDRLNLNPLVRQQSSMLDGGRNNYNRPEYDVLNFSRQSLPLQPLNPPVRCDAYIGRAEAVGKGVTLARAIDKLNIKLAINKVRPDIKKQQFHERPGLRRKRLRRVRWRGRFKLGFVSTVQRVQKMTKKGW